MSRSPSSGLSAQKPSWARPDPPGPPAICTTGSGSGEPPQLCRIATAMWTVPPRSGSSRFSGTSSHRHETVRPAGTVHSRDRRVGCSLSGAAVLPPGLASRPNEPSEPDEHALAATAPTRRVGRTAAAHRAVPEGTAGSGARRGLCRSGGGGCAGLVDRFGEHLGDVLHLDVLVAVLLLHPVVHHHVAEGARHRDALGPGGECLLRALDVHLLAGVLFHPHPGAAGAAT